MVCGGWVRWKRWLSCNGEDETVRVGFGIVIHCLFTESFLVSIFCLANLRLYSFLVFVKVYLAILLLLSVLIHAWWFLFLFPFLISHFHSCFHLSFKFLILG